MTTASERPARTAGLRHVALFVTEFEQCLDFYTRLLGMEIEWQPDPENVYLTSGNDNLALHKAHVESADVGQRLDHIGFILDTPEQVDEWHQFFVDNNVTIRNVPKTHRDGARSFYCVDPDGVVVQMIYHPPISKGK
jgi:catechol 2,3-dioxygenase-like lactoylglutathione lyase family enzyme